MIHIHTRKQTVLAETAAVEAQVTTRLERHVAENPGVLSSLAPSAEDVAPVGIAILPLKSFQKTGMGLQDVLEQIRTAMIIQALERCHGNQTEAAELLGLSRTTFVMALRSLKGQGINPTAYRIKAQLV